LKVRYARFTLKVDEKGRITIPQVVRELLDIEPGTLIELTVDESTKSIVIRPVFSGVLVTYRVALRSREELVEAVRLVIGEGSELKQVECRELECIIRALALDSGLAEHIAEKLRSKGLNIVEYSVA
jgi:AbrB family looped-hinge helix DNA binding protein